jgi:ACS family D-galactonate transporter-like MFS transporter
MQPQTLTGQATLVTPSRKRFFIMVLLFITVVINYLDRSNLSIAAPALTSELGIDPIHVGLIFSAFGWTYAAMQIPGGWLVDRVPPRILYTAALLLWSIATVMLGFAGSFIALFVCAWPSAPWKRRPIRSTAAWSRRGSRTRARHGHRFLLLGSLSAWRS